MYLINAQFDVLILLNLIKSSFSSYKNKALYSLLRILYNKEEKHYWYNFVFQNLGLHSSCKGNRAFADLRYGEEDSISPSTLIFPATKG